MHFFFLTQGKLLQGSQTVSDAASSPPASKGYHTWHEDDHVHASFGSLSEQIVLKLIRASWSGERVPFFALLLIMEWMQCN
jgi:hypothetical protein